VDRPAINRRQMAQQVLCTFVMGFVDNLLQPLLVGKDTQMPGYLVLISTLGGIAIFGLSGFIVGPVVAALFIAVWDIFSVSRQKPNL
jgi:predicted PurR-regulated permease PerM